MLIKSFVEILFKPFETHKCYFLTFHLFHTYTYKGIVYTRKYAMMCKSNVESSINTYRGCYIHIDNIIFALNGVQVHP